MSFSAWLIVSAVALSVFGIVTTIDVARKPRRAFERAERSKWFWVLAPIVGG